MTNASGSGQGPRATGHIFISHASADDAFVKELRKALEARRLPVWVDSRNLRGGTKLAREVEQAIEDAGKVIVVLSLNTVNSRWVGREIEKALEVEKRRQADGYSVIPLLLPGLTPAALDNWFDEEPLAVPIQLGPGGLADAMPDILTALGKRLSDDVLRRVGAALLSLARDPRPPGIVKLQGREGEGWRVRIGSYHILYAIDDQAQAV